MKNSFYDSTVGKIDDKFIHWCDDVLTADLDAFQNSLFTDIGKLLIQQRVSHVDFKEQLVSTLLKIEDRFVITIPSKIKGNRILVREEIAHELSHTFFYDYDINKLRKVVANKAGDRNLEFACDFLSRRILIPETRFETFRFEFLDAFRATNESNPIAKLRDFCDHFRVRFDTICKRMFDDSTIAEPVVFCIFKEDQNEYKAQRICTSSGATENGLFLPYPSKKKESMTIRPFLKTVITSAQRTNLVYGKYESNLDSESVLGFGNLKYFLLKKGKLPSQQTVYWNKIKTENSKWLFCFCFKLG